MTRVRRGDGTNYGIQSRSIFAEVVAVGDRSHAEKTVNLGGRSPELEMALGELKAAIQSAQLPSGTKSLMTADVAMIEDETSSDEPRLGKLEGYLKGLADKIKMANEILGNTTSMIGPVLKIASIIGLTAGSLGLV